LTPADIEVFVTPSQRLDFNTKDVEIMIWAHNYPERFQNLEERKDKIITGVRRVLREEANLVKITGWVWVLLQPTAFGRIQE